jgi:hypothetical protein
MGGTREDCRNEIPAIRDVAKMVWVSLPELMSSDDIVLVIHEVMDEADELGFLVASVGEVDGSSVETVIEYPFIILVILACPSRDSGTRKVHQFRMDGDLEGGVYGIL